MNSPRVPIWIPVYQWFAGLCDAATGLLLIFVPERTLQFMFIQTPPQPVEFTSFVGVFVLSVGLAYLYPALSRLTPQTQSRWETVWVLTALSRTVVAGFLGWKILSGRMEIAWLSVVLTDLSLASFQWFGLARGWLRMEVNGEA